MIAIFLTVSPFHCIQYLIVHCRTRVINGFENKEQNEYEKKNWQEQKIKLDDSIAVAHGSIESHILLVVQTKIQKADAGLLKDGF